jgi:serine/alanine adding enzyme
MELKVFESPGKEWDEFASRYTDLIFYQSVWSQVLKEGLGGQPLYFCLREGGTIVAGLPSVLLNFKIFKILYASIPYGNLIGEQEYFSPFIEILEDEFRKRRIDQVRIAESPFSTPYPLNSFNPLIAKCTLLDLKRFGQERFWESYREEIRRAIRKAQKKGLYVKRATSRDEVEVFYRLYLSSMKRNQSAAKYPLRWFHAFYEILIQRGMGDILFAMIGEGQYAAGVVLVHSATSYHYLHNGSVADYLEARPNDLTVDYIIRKAVKEGKTILDFMGSDRDDLSLIRFKEKWGSQSMDIQTYVKDYHPLRCRIWELGKKWASSKFGSLLFESIRH